jgi:hypothetical protein
MLKYESINIQRITCYGGWLVFFPLVSTVALINAHSTPLGLTLYHNLPRFVSPGAIHIQPFQGWGLLGTFSPGCTWGYSYSTLSGLGPTWHLFPRLHLGLLSRYASYYVSYSTLSGLGPTWHLFPRLHLGLLSRYASYYVSYSTLSGLGPFFGHPQVAPGAIISRSELLRFIFNPFRVGALLRSSPGFTWGYYLATRVTTFHIQPLWGCQTKVWTAVQKPCCTGIDWRPRL